MLKTQPMIHKLTQKQLQRYLTVLNEVERYRDLIDQEKEHLVRSVIEKPYMDLRCDWAFKHVFTDLSLLKMLLEDILPEDIQSVEKYEHLPNEIDKTKCARTTRTSSWMSW